MIANVRSRLSWRVSSRYLGVSRKNRKNLDDNVDYELEDMRTMYGKRSSKERADSVSDEMLRERLNHKRRMEKTVPPQFVIAGLKDLGFGRKKKSANVYNKVRADPYSLRGFTKTDPKTSTGAGMYISHQIGYCSLHLSGGHGLHLASASKNWPIFKHMLPEIAFAGHSNSGKVSRLIDAITTTISLLT